MQRPWHQYCGCGDVGMFLDSGHGPDIRWTGALDHLHFNQTQHSGYRNYEKEKGCFYIRQEQEGSIF